MAGPTVDGSSLVSGRGGISPRFCHASEDCVWIFPVKPAKRIVSDPPDGLE
jgi:hypothetical protein